MENLPAGQTAQSESKPDPLLKFPDVHAAQARLFAGPLTSRVMAARVSLERLTCCKFLTNVIRSALISNSIKYYNFQMRV